MNNRQRQLEREKKALAYTVALENGDLEQVTLILQEAETDAELERMILEINDVYAAELEEASQAEDEVLVSDLVHTHIRSSQVESETELPALTVGHVFARIHADAALRGRVERDALAATRNYQSVETPLPADLSLRGVSQLLEQLGVRVSRRFQDLFRDTAIFLRMGRNQGMARLAATRRQEQARRRPTRPPKRNPPAAGRPDPNPPDEETK